MFLRKKPDGRALGKIRIAEAIKIHLVWDKQV
jgi:hypothetical protein